MMWTDHDLFCIYFFLSVIFGDLINDIYIPGWVREHGTRSRWYPKHFARERITPPPFDYGAVYVNLTTSFLAFMCTIILETENTKELMFINFVFQSLMYFVTRYSALRLYSRTNYTRVGDVWGALHCWSFPLAAVLAAGLIWLHKAETIETSIATKLIF